MYVHGGQNTILLEDLFVLDLAAREWAEVALATSACAPSPRHSHALTVAEEKLYLFGGCDELGPAEQAMFCMALAPGGAALPK